MIRTIILLLVAVTGLAIVRSIVRDITRAFSKSMGSKTQSAGAPKGEPQAESVGKLVKDPQTGTYLDPGSAIQAEIGGTLYYFESQTSRDQYIKAQRWS